MKQENSDNVLIKTIGVTISKVCLYICCTVAMGMMISTCKIDEKTILQCEESCGNKGIKEVTSTSCECNNPEDTEISPFVLPSR